MASAWAGIWHAMDGSAGGRNGWDCCGLVAGPECHPWYWDGGSIIAVLPGRTWTHPDHLSPSVPRIPLPPPLPEQAEKKEERKIGRVGRRKALVIESKNHSKGPTPGRTGLRVKGAWRFHVPEQPTLGGLMGAGTPVSCLGEAFSYIYTHSSLCQP